MKQRIPAITLATREETLAFLAANDEMFDLYATPVKSLWLCSELNRFEADGYVYNAEAQARIMRENGLTTEQAQRRNPAKRTKTDGGLLGTLIYLAQDFRREQQLIDAGWARASQDVLATMGKQCRALCNGSLSGERVAVVKRMGDRLRLCPPKTRTKAYAEYEDWWVKPLSDTSKHVPCEMVIAH